MDTYILRINPEPWAMGTAFPMKGRGGAGISPNRKLVAFQAAAKEAILADYEPITLILDPILLRFYFSRKLETLSYGDKKAHANGSDATNMQKALEDAMQGILYKNDSQVVAVESVVCWQDADTDPFVIIEVANGTQYREDCRVKVKRILAWAEINKTPSVDTNKW